MFHHADGCPTGQLHPAGSSQRQDQAFHSKRQTSDEGNTVAVPKSDDLLVEHWGGGRGFCVNHQNKPVSGQQVT